MTQASTSESWRLFLAISIPDQIKAQLEQAQADLRATVAEGRIRWTRPEQLHLTLQFLGNVPAKDIEPLADAIRAACLCFGPLHLRAERVGFFPNPRRPRVVWVGVHDQSDHLVRLQRALATAARPLTMETTKEEFTGHVTLGRVKGLSHTEAQGLAKVADGMAERFFGDWVAGEVELFRSELSSKGVVHSSLAVAACGRGSESRL